MVQDRKLLTNKIEEWQQQWNLLSEQLTALTASRIRETRSEEKLRLKGLIDEAEAEREQVEQKLMAAQDQLAQLDDNQMKAINPAPPAEK